MTNYLRKKQSKETKCLLAVDIFKQSREETICLI